MGTFESKLEESYIKVKDTPTPNSKTCTLNTVPERLRYFADNYGDKNAAVFVSTTGSRQAVTFKELYNHSCQVARSYMNIGVKRHECVAINIRCCPEWLYFTFGAMIAGLRPVSISFTYTDGSDVVAMMEIMRTCSMVVMDMGDNESNWNIFSSLLDKWSNDAKVKSAKMPYLRYMVCLDRPSECESVKTVNEFMACSTQCEVLPEILKDEIAVMLQTSGSTGVPKLVAHTHESLLSLSLVFEHELNSAEDIYFCDRPFGWVGGFPFSLFTGQTRITQSGFCPQPRDRLVFMMDTVKRERCTTAAILPPVLQSLLRQKETLIGQWRLKSIMTGGQPVARTMASCVGVFCDNFVCGYGATEFIISNLNVVTREEDFVEYSCGLPIPGLEVKVVDEHGSVVSVNKRGEIYVRSKGMFQCYYNDPEKTRAVKTEDGWFKTDDMGRMTETGVLFVEGRKSDMILSGGMNVAPDILETVIKSCPGIESAILVPVSDETYYQTICACVLLKPDSTVTEKDIRNFCEKVHNDKKGLFTVLPTYYMIMDRYPETNSGKTSRRELTRMAEERFKTNN